MKKKTLEQVMETVTLEFIENEPIEAYDLFRWMEAELYHRKDYIKNREEEIQTLRRQLLLASSIIEDYKNRLGIEDEVREF